MKIRILPLLLIAAAIPWNASAQDDLYWDPADVVVAVQAAAPPPPPPPAAGPYRETLPSYGEDWEDYDYWEDQGYFYSSRIRRFHRPFTGFGYFDPVYSDLGFYDPWMMPGTSIYIGIGGFNDYAYWRRMNRWNWNHDWLAWRGWNTFGYRNYMDPWSFGPWGGYRVYDPWFDPYWGGACFNSGWGGGFGYGNPVFVNNFYGPNYFYNRPGYWFGNTNGVVDTRPTNQYYGPRSSDARTAPSRGTVRNPEYVGGGIPRLKDAIGTANLQPSGNDADTGGPGRRPSTTIPETRPASPARDPQPVGEASGTTRPAPSREPVAEPAPNRGNVSPARPLNPSEPVRRDPLQGRPSWSDTDKPAPQQYERSRESYREDYIRRRDEESRDNNRRNYREPAPRQENNPYRYDPPTRREQEQRPTQRQEPRSPRQDPPSRESPRTAPSRSFDSPSRGDDRPSWNGGSSAPSRAQDIPRSGGSDVPRGGGSPRRGG